MKLLLAILFSIVMPSCSPAKPPSPNALVLASVKSMPRGKGYAASQKDVDRLAANVSLKGKTFSQDLKKIGPTFCSGATYLVFLRTIERLGVNQTLPPKTLARYANLGVPDGEEIFGRWNANGPGTAKLFADLKCGVNFISYDHAQPGDVLKIWWTEAIGGKERGHLVIYLSQTPTTVTYWSSNQPDGYGKKTTPKSKIKHHLFSRLNNHKALKNAAKLPKKDPFLADMLRKDFTWQQVAKACKVRESP